MIEIELPPLRERRADIPALAHHFLDKANKRMGRSLEGFTNAAMDRLMSCEWTGNVRELENEIERIVALAGDESMVSADLRSGPRQTAPASRSASGISTEPSTVSNGD